MILDRFLWEVDTMSILGNWVVLSIAAVTAFSASGCLQATRHRDYCELQSHVLSSTTVLRKINVSVPWEYINTMLQAPDYTVPVSDLQSFLREISDTAFKKSLEESLWQGSHYAARPAEVKPTDMSVFRTCRIVFYDEASHFDTPCSTCMGFTAIWYLVDPQGIIVGAGALRPGNLIHAAGTRYRKTLGASGPP
ncbi:MAG: hypothetical protein FJ279_02630 [Planctomycetes bacterium]|nr:hypothetical protein [Planctomycetota bacterium]